MNYLFICTGNTCRSPMAEYFFNNLYAKNGDCATSAGIFAAEGKPPSKNAIAVMSNSGIDISTHKSQQVTAEMLANADFIYTMTEEQRVLLCSLFSEYENKTHVLGKGIPDPYGGDTAVYTDCANEIYRSILKLGEKT